jgi:uncharacterized protein YcaQ
MKPGPKLNRKQARQFVLKSQGLLGETRFTSADQVITQLGYVQIDTISVVERAHHHVIWNRLSTFRPGDLDQLFKDRKVFEYWSHAAAILPIERYRFTLNRKKNYQDSKHWFPKDKKIMEAVLDRIRADGPLRAKDFKAPPRKQSGWWEWSPAKKALEQHFMQGTLMSSHRQGFQKVYDLPERVLPQGLDTTLPNASQDAENLVLATLNAQGIATAAEIAYLRRPKIRQNVKDALNALLAQNTILPVEISESDQKYFAITKLIEEFLDQVDSASVPKRVSILSPFDSLVIQRDRLKKIFDFDYLIECYVPAPKRKYGYFTLPLLYGDSLVGRIDCKADRKKKTFHLLGSHFEQGFKQDMKFKKMFKLELEAFSNFNGCTQGNF